MMKRLLSLAVAGLVAVGMTGLAMAGIPDLDNSTATGGPGCVEISVDGSGSSMGAGGVTVTVTVRDGNGDPVVGYPFQDMWMGDDAGGTEITLCNGGSTAAANTNAAGVAFFTGAIAGGGTTNVGAGGGMQVYLAGAALNGLTLPLSASNPDLNGDLAVTSSGDLFPVPGGFANLYLNPVYDLEDDFNCDGTENLLDVTRFAGQVTAVVPVACP
jgi:hypothetical protein